MKKLTQRFKKTLNVVWDAVRASAVITGCALAFVAGLPVLLLNKVVNKTWLNWTVGGLFFICLSFMFFIPLFTGVLATITVVATYKKVKAFFSKKEK